MGEQYQLFETEERRWTQRVWQGLDPATRNQLIGTLAAMALASLRRTPPPPTPEHSDDA